MRTPGRRLWHVASPDWTTDQVRLAFGGRASSDAVRALEDRASDTLGLEVLAFGTARAAMAIAFAAARPHGGTVYVPAYTCVAVPNAIRAANLTASWMDVAGANLDLGPLMQRPLAGSAVIAQHTYGIGFDALALEELRRAGAFVLEDRAHRFDGADVRGDAVVFSLEHSKVVSAGQGGLLWVEDADLRMRIIDARAALVALSDDVIRRAMRTSAVQSYLGRGRPAHVPGSQLVRRVALRVPALSAPGQTPDELQGGPVELVAMHPLAAAIGLGSLRRVAENITHRQMLANVYRQSLGELVPTWARDDTAYVRQPIVVPDAVAATASLRSRGIELGVRWFNAPVHPAGSVSSYQEGSAPHAEDLAARALSLPTHLGVTREDARSIAAAVIVAARGLGQ